MLRWEHFTRTTAGKLCQSNVSKANNDRSPNINVKDGIRAPTPTIFYSLIISPSKNETVGFPGKHAEMRALNSHNRKLLQTKNPRATIAGMVSHGIRRRRGSPLSSPPEVFMAKREASSHTHTTTRSNTERTTREAGSSVVA